ncbi:hypothetical protein JST97_19380 [bacterium]|nr:hypothetical protein [bacterium]
MRNFCLLFLIVLPCWCQEVPNPPSTTVLQPPVVLPDMRGIPEFSERSNFLSLVGYLRQQAFLNNGEWLTRQQSVAALNEQVESVLEGASR